MNKIIILGSLLVIVVILLLLTISDNDSGYIEKPYRNEDQADTIRTDWIDSIETNHNIFFFEDFSKINKLDGWKVDFQNAANWIYDFNDSTGVIVKDIINKSFSNDLYGPWANVILEKTIPIKDSIIFVSKISWDSFDSNTIMQHIYFSFKDQNGKELLFFGYNDPYISYKGGILSKFYDKPYNWHKKRELPYNGNCLLKMIKNGEQVKLYYNNDILMESTIVENFEKLNIIFGFFPSINYKDSNLKSTFGELNVEYIKFLDNDISIK
ncbi:MAG: hypothetical protein PF487_14025 [Bacteroidales bacterium]|jgi:hypothetical protein|nr:hypothetical protein [Bacteroidales bacterium]